MNFWDNIKLNSARLRYTTWNRTKLWVIFEATTIHEVQRQNGGVDDATNLDSVSVCVVRYLHSFSVGAGLPQLNILEDGVHVVGVHVVLGRALHPARAGGVELLLVTPGPVDKDVQHNEQSGSLIDSVIFWKCEGSGSATPVN